MLIHLTSDRETLIVNTLEHAFQRVEHDVSFWKISFSLPSGEVIQLVRRVYLPKNIVEWVYQPVVKK